MLFSCINSTCVSTPLWQGFMFWASFRVCCWPPAPDPQLGESWPLEQVHMLGLEQKPSPHEFLQIAGKTNRRVNWLCVVFSNTWWNRIIQPLFVIFSLSFVVSFKDELRRGNLRTIHWFPPGRVFQPGQQYEWKREPHTLGLMKTRKKEQTNSLITQTSRTYFSETPKQIHKVIFWAAPDLRGLCFQNKQNYLWYKASGVMDGVIPKRGGEEGNARWPKTWATFCFHWGLNLNLERQDV